MKAIVSSLLLKKSILKAMEIKATSVLVRDKEIMFYNTSDEVKIPLSNPEDRYYHAFEFDYTVWVRVYTFLKTLEEQPIKIEIDSSGIDIYNYVKRFRSLQE